MLSRLPAATAGHIEVVKIKPLEKLRTKSIMVFDEATSSLDSRAEKNILEAMDRVRGDYTSLVIAHRLSTVVDADLILVLDLSLIHI